MTNTQLLIAFLALIWICCTVYACVTKDGNALGAAAFITIAIGIGYLILHDK